jgi:hypothetical protein
MAYFDDKQKKLILSWVHMAGCSDDAYMQFMMNWIAFNGICYNLYNTKALIERVNIDKNSSRLNMLRTQLADSALDVELNGNLGLKDGKIMLELMAPINLRLSIQSGYAENRIFQEFVKEYAKHFEAMDNFRALFEVLKSSLKKTWHGRDYYYVINMAKLDLYDTRIDYTKMKEKTIVIECAVFDLNVIQRVLYQVRCNIFHGEKIPGDINDDRIVKSALPLLQIIVDELMRLNHIETRD